jgi:hypothetical protein
MKEKDNSMKWFSIVLFVLLLFVLGQFVFHYFNEPEAVDFGNYSVTETEDGIEINPGSALAPSGPPNVEEPNHLPPSE